MTPPTALGDRALEHFLRALMGDDPSGLGDVECAEVEVALLVLEARALTLRTLERAQELGARASAAGGAAPPYVSRTAEAARATLRSINQRIARNKRAADALAAMPTRIGHEDVERFLEEARAVWRVKAPHEGRRTRAPN